MPKLDSIISNIELIRSKRKPLALQIAYDNITVQLSKKNTRFQYKLIKGARASEFENAV